MIRARKLIYCFIFLLLLLTACSNDENNSNSENDNDIVDESTDAGKNNNGVNEDNNKEKSSQYKVGEDEWAEDDTGLGMGDTGLSDSNIGKAEITLDSAEKIDKEELEIDDVENTDITQIISVNITVKNIGENDFDPEDVLYSGELRTAGKEYGNEWGYFEGVSEEWQDNLEPDETTSGVIVFNHKDKDAYELIFGSGLSGLGNKTQFEFNKDEMDE